MKKIRLSRKRNQRFYANNLGLHCHCAVSKEKLLQLLRMAKQENVGVLVVNNYKDLEIFTKILPQLTTEELSEFADMKMIPAVEIPGSFRFTNTDGQSYTIETHILGYGVDLSKEELLKRFCENKFKSINQEEELQRLIKIGHEIGLKFCDEDAYLDINDDNRKFAGRAFVQALMKNMDDNFCKEGEENKNKLPFELRTNWRAFQNRCVKDYRSPFFLDVASLNPDVGEVLDLIHQMGGRAYLGHPSSYFAKVGSKEDIEKAFRDVIKFAKDFLQKYSPQTNRQTYIDGAEVYHPSYVGNIEVISEIKEMVKAHRIGSSGGTDIHVDKTLGSEETVSSDSLGGKVTAGKLRKYIYLRKKAVNIMKLRERTIDLSNKKGEDGSRV